MAKQRNINSKCTSRTYFSSCSSPERFGNSLTRIDSLLVKVFFIEFLFEYGMYEKGRKESNLLFIYFRTETRFRWGETLKCSLWERKNELNIILVQ